MLDIWSGRGPGVDADSRTRFYAGVAMFFPRSEAPDRETRAMKIEAVDFFYVSMPVVTTEADGSQDALLVRVRSGGHEGWGECEAVPLPSIAAFVCPMSHGVCRPVGASILGQTLNGPDDIARISKQVAYDSMDLLQAAHTMSGVEMAM